MLGGRAVLLLASVAIILTLFPIHAGALNPALEQARDTYASLGSSWHRIHTRRQALKRTVNTESHAAAADVNDARAEVQGAAASDDKGYSKELRNDEESMYREAVRKSKQAMDDGADARTERSKADSEARSAELETEARIAGEDKQRKMSLKERFMKGVKKAAEKAAKWHRSLADKLRAKLGLDEEKKAEEGAEEAEVEQDLKDTEQEAEETAKKASEKAANADAAEVEKRHLVEEKSELDNEIAKEEREVENLKTDKKADVTAANAAKAEAMGESHRAESAQEREGSLGAKITNAEGNEREDQARSNREREKAFAAGSRAKEDAARKDAKMEDVIRLKEKVAELKSRIDSEANAAREGKKLAAAEKSAADSATKKSAEDLSEATSLKNKAKSDEDRSDDLENKVQREAHIANLKKQEAIDMRAQEDMQRGKVERDKDLITAAIRKEETDTKAENQAKADAATAKKQVAATNEEMNKSKSKAEELKGAGDTQDDKVKADVKKRKFDMTTEAMKEKLSRDKAAEFEAEEKFRLESDDVQKDVQDTSEASAKRETDEASLEKIRRRESAADKQSKAAAVSQTEAEIELRSSKQQAADDKSKAESLEEESERENDAAVRAREKAKASEREASEETDKKIADEGDLSKAKAELTAAEDAVQEAKISEISDNGEAESAKASAKAAERRASEDAEEVSELEAKKDGAQRTANDDAGKNAKVEAAEADVLEKKVQSEDERIAEAENHIDQMRKREENLDKRIEELAKQKADYAARERSEISEAEKLEMADKEKERRRLIAIRDEHRASRERATNALDAVKAARKKANIESKNAASAAKAETDAKAKAESAKVDAEISEEKAERSKADIAEHNDKQGNAQAESAKNDEKSTVAELEAERKALEAQNKENNIADHLADADALQRQADIERVKASDPNPFNVEPSGTYSNGVPAPIDNGAPEGSMSSYNPADVQHYSSSGQSLPAVASDPSASSSAGHWVIPAEVLQKAKAAPAVRYDDAPAWNGKAGCSGQFTAGAASLKSFLMKKFPGAISSIGGYACRQNTANKSKTSVHGSGRALDIMIKTKGGRADSAKGDPIANYLMANAGKIGLQYMIWDRWSWSQSRKRSKKYGGPNPHIDHLHVEINNDAARKSGVWWGDSPTPTSADQSSSNGPSVDVTKV